MAPTPSVTVIMPAHSAAPYVADAIASVLVQREVAAEVVLVADDDHDYAATLADAGLTDRRVRHLRTDGDRGPSVARNIGLDAARAPFIAPLDADDRFHAGRLARLAALAERHGAASDNRLVVDGDGRALGTVRPASAADTTLTLDAFLDILPPIALLARREHFADGWDESLRFAEDTLANARVVERAGGLGFHGQPLHEYRVVPGSACHADDSAARADEAYAAVLAGLAEHGWRLAGEPARAALARAVRQRRAVNAAFAASDAPDYCTYLLDTGRLWPVDGGAGQPARRGAPVPP